MIRHNLKETQVGQIHSLLYNFHLIIADNGVVEVGISQRTAHIGHHNGNAIRGLRCDIPNPGRRSSSYLYRIAVMAYRMANHVGTSR